MAKRAHNNDERATRQHAAGRRTVRPVLALAALCASASSLGAANSYCVTCSNPDLTYNCEIAAGPNAPRGTAGQLYCITELAKRGGHETCKVRRNANDVCDGIDQVLAPGLAANGLPFAEHPQESEPLPPGTVSERDQEIIGPAMKPALRDSDPSLAKPPATAGPPSNLPSGSRQQAADPAPPPPGDAEAPKPQGPPKTVEELANRTYRSSQKNLESAGETVGSSAKSAGEAVSNVAKKTGEQIGKAGSAVGNAAKKTWNCLSSLFADC